MKKNSRVRRMLREEIKGDLTPMIDVVFLLLIYFMVTTTLIKQEADLGIKLPSQVPAKATEELPSMQTIEIRPDGSVFLNGAPISDDYQANSLPGLIATLTRLKATSDRAGVKTVVTLFADPVSPHLRTIQVLDACAAARIQFVSFGNL